MRMKAFPTLADNGHITTQDGMDLRDWFAGMVIQSLAMSFESDPDWDAYEQAALAYSIADAMLEVRKDD